MKSIREVMATNIGDQGINCAKYNAQNTPYDTQVQLIFISSSYSSSLVHYYSKNFLSFNVDFAKKFKNTWLFAH